MDKDVYSKEELIAAFPDAVATGCPHWYFYHGLSIWIAKETPPCHKKTCGRTSCHNYGRPVKRAHRHHIIEEIPRNLSDHLRQLVRICGF